MGDSLLASISDILAHIEPNPEEQLSKLASVLEPIAGSVTPGLRQAVLTHWMPSIANLKSSTNTKVHTLFVKCYSQLVESILAESNEPPDIDTFCLIVQGLVLAEAPRREIFSACLRLLNSPLASKSKQFQLLLTLSLDSTAQVTADIRQSLSATWLTETIVDYLCSLSGAPSKSSIDLIRKCTTSLRALGPDNENSHPDLEVHLEKLFQATINCSDEEMLLVLSTAIARLLVFAIPPLDWFSLLGGLRGAVSIKAIMDTAPSLVSPDITRLSRSVQCISAIIDELLPLSEEEWVEPLCRAILDLVESIKPSEAMSNIMDDEEFNKEAFNAAKKNVAQASNMVKAVLDCLARYLRQTPLRERLVPGKTLPIIACWASTSKRCSIWNFSARNDATEILKSEISCREEKELVQVLDKAISSTLSDDMHQHIATFEICSALLGQHETKLAGSPVLFAQIARKCISLMQDYRSETKILALPLMKQLLQSEHAAPFRRDLLEPILKSLHVRTAAFLEPALDIVVLICKQFTSEEIHIPSLQDLVWESILYELNYVQQLSLLRIYTQHLLPLVDIFGHRIMTYTLRLIPRVLWLMDTKMDPLVIEAATCLQTTIKHAWPRMEFHAPKIFGVCVAVYIDFLDDPGVDSETVKQNALVRAALCETLFMLKCAAPSKVWNTLREQISGLPELEPLAGELDSYQVEPSEIQPPPVRQLPTPEETKKRFEELLSGGSQSAGSRLRSVGRSGLSLSNLIISNDISASSSSSFSTGPSNKPRGPLIQILD